MVNSSLAYEILIYLNGFYFSMYATCEVGMGVLKFVNLDYDDSKVVQETIILVGLCLIETIRIQLGRRGSLSENAWQVWVSVVLTVPVVAAVIYLLRFQVHILMLEYLLGGLMLILLLTELSFAFLFLFTICKTPTYD